MSRQDVKMFIRRSVAEGWVEQPRRGSGHHLLVHGKTGQSITIPSTPSDHRWVKNAEACKLRVLRHPPDGSNESPAISAGNQMVDTWAQVETKLKEPSVSFDEDGGTKRIEFENTVIDLIVDVKAGVDDKLKTVEANFRAGIVDLREKFHLLSEQKASASHLFDANLEHYKPTTSYSIHFGSPAMALNLGAQEGPHLKSKEGRTASRQRKSLTPLGKKMHLIMAKLGIKQHEFAKLIGVASAAVSQWKYGVTRPANKNIRRIADLSERSVDWVIGDF